MIIFEMIGLSMLDSLNPVTIATMIILIPIVKKKSDSLMFILSTYFIYTLSAIIFLLGLDKIITLYFDNVKQIINTYLVQYQQYIGFILLIMGIYFMNKLIIKFKNSQLFNYTPSPLTLKLTTPLSIFILGIYSTLLDIPTAIPLIGFISILTSTNLNLFLSITLLLIYCFIYISPMIFVYLLSKKDWFFKFQNKILKIMNAVNQVLLPTLLILIGLILI